MCQYCVLVLQYLCVSVSVRQVYGDKDTDGFYRGEVRGRTGLIPCNMVSEIRAEDEETLEQLIKQGFLPLSTPVDRIGTIGALSASWRGHSDGHLRRRLFVLPELNRRGLRRYQASRRMVALYDYNPRESSPNVDVEVSRPARTHTCTHRQCEPGVRLMALLAPPTLFLSPDRLS